MTLDLNEQLLKPALETLPGCWDKLFDTNGKQSVAKLAGNFVNQWHKTVGDINSWLGDDVVKIGMVSTQFVELCTSSASVLVFELVWRVVKLFDYGFVCREPSLQTTARRQSIPSKKIVPVK